MTALLFKGIKAAYSAGVTLYKKKEELEQEATKDENTGRIPGKTLDLGGIPLRITFINGINNTFESCRESARALSDKHSGAQVDFIADPSRGIISDLTQAIVLDTVGVETEAARRLVKLWRKLFEEMDNDQGQIIHYAHSRGGMVTTQAMQALKEQEKDRLVVHNIGSPTHNPHKKAVHHESSGDIVPSLSAGNVAAQIRSLLGLETVKPVVVKHESLTGEKVSDHGFLAPTYSKVIDDVASCIIERPSSDIPEPAASF